MGLCIICKNDRELTDEHIVPEFIGGGLIYRAVCETCNREMGGGFEGRLCNSVIFKGRRYMHDIKGKSQKAPFPFEGVYKHGSTGTRFKINDSGEFTTIPKIELLECEDGLKFHIDVDESEFDSVSELIEIKLVRYFKAKGEPIDVKKIREGVASALESSVLKQRTITNPEITEKVSIGVDDLYLLPIKIGYELACYHFGLEYMKDEVAELLRRSLKNQSLADSVLIESPVENDIFEQVVSDDYHWVVYMANTCYVRIFGSSSLFKFVSNESQFCSNAGIVYRFCFKSRTNSNISLMELLGQNMVAKYKGNMSNNEN